MKFLKELISWIESLFKRSSTIAAPASNHIEGSVSSLLDDTYTILITIHTPLIKEKTMTPISKTARIDQIVTLAAASFSDVDGNAVSVANPIVWTIDNPALATLTPSPDGTTVVVTPLGPLGVANVTSTVNSNTDTATPAVTVIGAAEITFVAGLAVSVVLTATVTDTTIDQAATAPAAAVAPVAAAAPAAAPVAVDPTVVAAATPAVDPTAAAATPAAVAVDATVAPVAAAVATPAA